MYVCMYIYIYIYKLVMRGWRNIVELVLLEISSSMEPYTPRFHAYSGKKGPVRGFFELKQLDEVSYHNPPTCHVRALAGYRPKTVGNPRITFSQRPQFANKSGFKQLVVNFMSLGGIFGQWWSSHGGVQETSCQNGCCNSTMGNPRITF